MRHFVLFLLCCIVLLGCSDEPPVVNSPKTPEELLVGVWEWEKTDGGFRPTVIVPEPGEEREILILYPDGTFYNWRPRDTMAISGSYRVDRNPLVPGDPDTTLKITFDGGQRTPMTVTANRLEIDARAWDGLRMTYRRKGIAEACEATASAWLVNLAVVDPFPDPFQWKDMSVRGDVLCATVQYSGGCKPHQFHLSIDTVMRDDQQTYINAILSHNANGDACRAHITEKVGFDLTPLRAYAESIIPIDRVPRVVTLRISGGDRQYILRYHL